MAPVKVLEVVEAAGGGVLRHLLQIAQHLDNSEFDLTLAVSPGRMLDAERDLQRFRDVGVRVETVPMVRRLAPISDIAALHRLISLMRGGRYDVVHAHSSKAGFLGRMAARKAGIKRTFYTPHAFAFQCGGLAGWLYRRLELAGARLGGTLVAVSESEKALAVRHGIASAGQIRVIRNGITAPEPPTAAQRAEARTKLGLAEDAAVVGTVGRLARQKGLVSFLRAAKLVLRDRADVRFVIIGAGPLGPRLAKLAKTLRISASVLLAGHRADAQDLYAAMDVYAQPSLWEGLPYALLDAMGRGLPVVATDVPGNNDVVRHGQTGLLVPPRRPPALADAILALLDDPDQRSALGRAARELVLREHDLADFIRSIADLYRGIY